MNRLLATIPFLAHAYAAVLSSPPTLYANVSVSIGAQTNYWLGDPTLTHGKLPNTPDGYQFFRNVKNFGAVGDGVADDTEAINAAMRAFNEQNTTDFRCGMGTKCGSTSTLSALVYFPPGTYLITKPIIHYFFTQMVGDAASIPTLKASSNFTSDSLYAMVDTDPYTANGQWYINQNQFLRQIRNFKFDLQSAPPPSDPTALGTMGIHWQVSQATSLQNIEITMPQGSTRHLGIFTENGSGGFVSDLTLNFGMWGWVVGNQQFLARALKFVNPIEAIKMNWDWGFVWKSISIFSSYKSFNVAQFDTGGNQGIGCISVIDSTIDYVPYGITLNQTMPTPNIILDNVVSSNSQSIVQWDGGDTILAGAPSGQKTIDGWAFGNIVNSTDGQVVKSKSGWTLDPPIGRPATLLDASGNGKIFERSKPQYGDVPRSSVINVLDFNVSNAGTGDQSSAINSILATHVGSLIFFPAGIYTVADTVVVPVGSKIVGEGWSQIMAYGANFQDETQPRAMVRVGCPGDSGVIEISDMLFTVRGATAGAVLVEWNVHESTQGSAGMWDSHFRVGGAAGSDLTIAECNRTLTEVNQNCKAASLLMHLTPESSGYFENIWGWVSDHDLDAPIPDDAGDTSSVMINVYSARGMLIESQGPTWMYATAAEHNTLYQYQIVNAKNLYMAHSQTESPYFQPNILPTQPFAPGQFPADPTYDNCAAGQGNCTMSWAMRIINSTDVVLHGAGFYSFFNGYVKCSGVAPEAGICQDRAFELIGSERITVFNVYTVGVKEIITPNGIQATLQGNNTQNGYSTELGVWHLLAQGAKST